VTHARDSVRVPTPDPIPVVPCYDDTGLGAVLPGAARALGTAVDRPAITLPSARSVCVVLIDGLGRLLLEEAAADAPFLTSLLAGGRELIAGCPSTTATSMGSFGTGLSPGQHGLLGYEVMDPDRGVLLNELKWDPGTDPLAWQPHPTVFQVVVADGVTVTRVGNPEFDDSGLTLAALRGGDFVAAKRLYSRVDIAVAALATPGRSLVYLYWGDLDGAGHAHGWRSPHWNRELRDVDREMARLARRLPVGTVLVITADHGMVDVPHGDRVDLAEHPELAAGVRILGGEARFAQAYCEPGQARAVATRLADALGGRAWVRTRDEAIDAGWFGRIDNRVRPRLGDVLVAGIGSFALVDSRTATPHVLRLIGQHGSLTADEQLVPLLVHTG
jgi:Type I phosphodiesterase / nucleotide pyrophosphatase